MREEYIYWIVLVSKCLAGILAGLVGGNGLVYIFNKIPVRWYVEYGKEPRGKLLDMSQKRMKASPWKYIFSMILVAFSIWLVQDDWKFAVAAFCTMWLILLISIGDWYYKVIPDQLLILLALCSIGFLSYHASWKSIALGGLCGGIIMGLLALVGYLLYKKATIGGGDVKLFFALGLCLGLGGVLFVMASSILLSGTHALYKMLQKTIKKGDCMPLAPYVAIATGIYFVARLDRLFWL